jgi:hypothetical protein
VKQQWWPDIPAPAPRASASTGNRVQRWLTAALLLGLVFGATLSSATPATQAQATSCELVLGFRTLHDLIPSIVGDCIENEWHNAENGDGLQRTTKGLMVWRKIDNWTAFTDGYLTWINGPYGLQSRLNTQIFPWEPLGAPVPAPPAESTGGGSASGATEAGGATTPANEPPTLDLDVPRRVDSGESFTIRLTAENDQGIDSMWWWATSTDDDSLRDTHSVNCRGATPCRKSWDVTTTDEGTIRIHAVARGADGQVSGEEVDAIEVRPPESTSTPTPTLTPTATPTPRP